MNNIDIVSPTTYQFVIFMEAIMIGFCLGFLLDFYRSMRNTISFSYKITIFTDFIFWIVATVASIILLFVILWGEVHLYTYVGLAVGFVVYYFLLSRYIIFLWNKVFTYLIVIVKFFLKCIHRILAIRMFVKLPFFHSSTKK